MAREFPKNNPPQNTPPKIPLPTVGRIVLYTSEEYPVAVPAIVQRATPGQLACGLTVFVHDGVLSCGLVAHKSESAPGFECWDWMDYQKGQAAKTEQLEDQLKSSSDRPTQPHERFGGRTRGGISDTSEGKDMGKLQAGAPSPEDGKR